MRRVLKWMARVGALVWLLAACRPLPTAVPTPAPTAPPSDDLRLFLINGYGAESFWASQMQTGLLETLARRGYSVAEKNLVWSTLHMDAGGPLTVAGHRALTEEAIAAIQAFAPDVVVVAGDEAAAAIILQYPDATMPFVFCGLKGDPRDYALVQPNVTGVLERYQPAQTVAMARDFIGEADAYMLLSDASLSGRAGAELAYARALNEVPETHELLLRVVGTWSQWQAVVLEETATMDFIILGSYQAILDDVHDVGRYVEGDRVMEWMVTRAPVPVFALSNDAVVRGAVGGLVSSGYAQGETTAPVAVQVAQGASPGAISARAPYRNLLAMNLPAARNWGLPIPVSFPLAARVYRTFPADQGGQ